MKLETAQARVDLVNETRKKHPELSIEKVCKKAGMAASQYYSAKKFVETGSDYAHKTAKPVRKKISTNYNKLIIPEAQPVMIPRSSGGRITMLIGTPADIREFMGGAI